MDSRTVLVFVLGGVAGYYVGPRLVGRIQAMAARAAPPPPGSPAYVVR